MRTPHVGKVRTVRTRVRYGETDQMGVVYHPNFLCYFEIGRTEFLRDSGANYAELERRGHFLMVVDATLRYSANVGYDAPIVIHTAVGEMGPASVLFVYEVEDETGRLLCAGSTKLACCDAAKKPVRLPADILTKLKE